MRSDKEIRKIALSDQISKLTNEEYDQWINVIKPKLYERQPKAHGGKVCRGRKANYKA